MKKLSSTIDKEFTREDALIKISSKIPCPLSDIKQIFTEEELDQVLNLFSEGLISLTWNEDVPHQEYQELNFTICGELELFKAKNFETIQGFKEVLEYGGYNSELVDDFLIRSNLSLTPDKILTIDNFEYFCTVFQITK